MRDRLGDDIIIRAKAKVWDAEAATQHDGFVEVEDVKDGTVSLCISGEDVEEIKRVWLTPAKARRVAVALADVAAAIEGRDDD